MLAARLQRPAMRLHTYHEPSRLYRQPAAMQRHLTWLQLCQHYSATGRLGQTRLERAEELRRYHRGTARFSEGLLDTELRCGAAPWRGGWWWW